MTASGLTLGRYLLCSQVASGGMATVHLGRMLGPDGFARVVAIKRLHPHLAREPNFAAMFLDEARLAARIRHSKVVPILDVVSAAGEVLIVMEYVLGQSFAELLRAAGAPTPPDIAAAIVIDALEGLHAAHEARGDDGVPLGLVHRDVSPQNVLVGVDGGARLVDFGIAKARGRSQETRDGELKGKASYMPPEQVRGRPLDRRADVYAAGVVLWEALTGRRLFTADEPMTIMLRVCEETPPPPSRFVSVPPEVDALVMRALAKGADERYGSAREFADAIERTMAPASPRTVARWVQSTLGERLAALEAAMEAAARATPGLPQPPSTPTAPPTEDAGARPEARRVRRRWIAGAAVLSLIVGTSIVLRGRMTAEIPPAVSTPTFAAFAQASALPSPSVPVPAEPSASVETPFVDLENEPSATRRLRTPTKTRNCDPPWILGPDGIKTLKPDCR